MYSSSCAGRAALIGPASDQPLGTISYLYISQHSIFFTLSLPSDIFCIARVYCVISQKWVWEERGAQKMFLVISEKAASVTGTTLLRTTNPAAGGFSASNAIGTKMGDLINWGLTQWRLTV